MTKRNPGFNAGFKLTIALLLAGVLGGCTTVGNRAIEQARADFAVDDDLAVLGRLEARVKAEPEDRELRTFYLRQRERVIVRHLAAAERAARAGQVAEAGRLYDEILRFSPQESRAAMGKQLLARAQHHGVELTRATKAIDAGDIDTAENIVTRVLAEDSTQAQARMLAGRIDEMRAAMRPPAETVIKGPFSKPVSLDFRDAPLQNVFEALSRAAGVNFVFDRDVRADARVTIFVRDSTVDQVLRLLTATQKIERKVLNSNSVLIYPATTAKAKQYRELVTRSFYLANADVRQAQAMVRMLAKTRDVFVDEKLRLMVVKDTPEAVALAAQLIKSLDVAEPEVMLEVEVLEVKRTKLLELGLDFPDQVGYGALTGTGTSAELAGSLINLRNRGGLVPFVANPALLLNLRHEDGDTSLLANPRIRVKNAEEAKIHIGDKLPVFTTTATANVGVSASVTYLDVGLKLDVKPVVLLSDEVEIKIGLEVSNIVREVPGPSSSLAYQIGTRTAETVLRLKDGETQVLAGLLQDEERSVGNRIPGIGDIPLLGRLFSNQRDTADRTEIVLLITPRVIRNVITPDVARVLQPAGTETNIGAEPLTFRPTAPGSLALSSDNSPVTAPGVGGRGGAFRGQSFFAQRNRGFAPEAVTAGDPPPEDDDFEAGDSEGEREVDAAIAEPLTVSVSGPAQVSAGGSVEVSVRVTGGGLIDGGQVTLQYDPGRIDAPGATEPGTLVVDIPNGQDEIVTTATFNTRPGTIGNVNIAPVSAMIARDGRAEPVSPEGGVNVSITP